MYGKPGTNRLNLAANGSATNTITIPATATLANGDVIDIASRFNGPATIASGTAIPRNALEGLPLHKVDLRLTKDFKIVGSTKISLIGEVYNLFNHHNYGSYNTSLSATAAATTAVFGQPQQNTGNAYVWSHGERSCQRPSAIESASLCSRYPTDVAANESSHSRGES